MATIVASCCGCGSLKYGSIFAGVFSIMISVITLILLFATKLRFQTIIVDTLPDWIVKTIIAVNMVMTILVSIPLIIGAIKRNKFMMLPWIWLAIMLAIGLIISVIYSAIICFINHEWENNVMYGLLWLFLGLPATALFVYLWVVVYSYFQLLMEEDGRGKYGKPLRR